MRTIDWGELVSAILIHAVFSFLAVGGAIIGLGFAGENALEGKAPIFWAILFCGAWLFFIWLGTDWRYIILED